MYCQFTPPEASCSAQLFPHAEIQAASARWRNNGSIQSKFIIQFLFKKSAVLTTIRACPKCSLDTAMATKPAGYPIF